jgi:AP-1 complex subunit gamma-1
LLMFCLLHLYPAEQKALAMRIRMSYKVNGEERLEQGQVSNFPSGL